jgi:hypothetical protein
MCHCEPKPKPSRSLVRSAILIATALVVVLAAAAVPRAQDEPPAPLKPGDDVPGPFRPWAFTGKHVETLRRRILATIRETDDNEIKELKKKQAAAIQGMFHCPVSEHGLNPVVLVFVKGTTLSDTLLQLLQKLDEAVPRHERVRAAAAVVFLDEAIKDIVKDDDLRSAVTAALEPKLNPLANLTAAVDAFEPVQKQYRLNPETDITVLVCNKLKVVSIKSVMNRDLDDKGVEDLMKDIEEKLTALGPKPPAEPKPPK